ncbi:MAG: hypothetical protein JWL85_813 [Candidatus Saccharibacteria bacterium]|nr:hypothetical protein [Candidatus Saccharibacteria bacterium]
MPVTTEQDPLFLLSSLRESETVRTLAVVASSLLALAGCSDSGGGPTPERTSASNSSEHNPSVGIDTSPSPKATNAARAVLTFDTLGGGDPTVKTYRGAGETAADKTPTSYSYRDGDQEFIKCIVRNGRLVRSHPELGEKKKESKIWYGLFIPGENQNRENKPPEQFATQTYAKDVPPKVQKSLRSC